MPDVDPYEDMEYDLFSEDFDDQEEKFADTTREQKIEILQELLNQYEKKPSEESLKDSNYLIQVLIEESVDYHKLDYYLQHFFRELMPYEQVEEYFDEFIGGPVTETEKQKLTEKFEQILSSFYEKPKQSVKRIKKLPDTLKNLPCFKFMELKAFNVINNDDEYPPMLDQYLSEHPDYPLFKILKILTTIDHSSGNNLYFEDIFPGQFFGERKTLHSVEMESYISLLIHYGLKKEDVTWFAALKIFLSEEFNEEDNNFGSIIMSLSFMQINLILNEEGNA